MKKRMKLTQEDVEDHQHQMTRRRREKRIRRLIDHEVSLDHEVSPTLEDQDEHRMKLRLKGRRRLLIVGHHHHDDGIVPRPTTSNWYPRYHPPPPREESLW